MATEYTGGTADGVDAAGDDTDIGVTMGVTTASVLEIDTSVFSTTFKDLFKQDSLGVFTLTGGDAGNFSINAKTGKVTSTAAMVASADANTASTSADALNVVYTPRTSSGLSAHTEALCACYSCN